VEPHILQKMDQGGTRWKRWSHTGITYKNYTVTGGKVEQILQKVEQVEPHWDHK